MARDWIVETVCNEWNVDARFCDGATDVPNPIPGPTPNPTLASTPNPSGAPTPNPTPSPTKQPTIEPTPSPTAEPTPMPTNEPVVNVTPFPTSIPTTTSTESPTSIPTSALSSSDSPSVSPTALTCTGGEVMLEFAFTTDDFPQETDWQIVRIHDGGLVLNGGPYNEIATTYEYKRCMSNSCHMLILYDSWGDGMMNSSSYVVKMDGVPKVTNQTFVGTWKNVMFNC
jgi:hypothetical protein